MTRTVPVGARFAATPLAASRRLLTFVVVSRPVAGGPAGRRGEVGGE